MAFNDKKDVKIYQGFNASAKAYAESYLHIPTGTVSRPDISPIVKEAITMLTDHYYETRLGTSAKYEETMNKVHNLLNLSRTSVPLAIDRILRADDDELQDAVTELQLEIEKRIKTKEQANVK